jgi:hypothetical protein
MEDVEWLLIEYEMCNDLNELSLKYKISIEEIENRLLKSNYKKCSCCNLYKINSYVYFQKNGNICKYCRSIKDKIRYQNNKESINKHNREYNKNNKERLSVINKQYYINNKEILLEYNKKYREDNKEKIQNYQNQYSYNNREKKIEYSKQYDLEHKEEKAKYMKEYMSNHKEEKIEYDKDYYEKNKLKIITRSVNYKKNKLKIDPIYKLKSIVYSIITIKLKSSLNNESLTEKLHECLPYIIEELKNHLESQFVEGMCWENHGIKWHIDHKRPISSFNIKEIGDEEFLKCWSLENLQPLWSDLNLKKSNKWDGTETNESICLQYQNDDRKFE